MLLDRWTWDQFLTFVQLGMEHDTDRLEMLARTVAGGKNASHIPTEREKRRRGAHDVAREAWVKTLPRIRSAEEEQRNLEVTLAELAAFGMDIEVRG